MMSCFPEKTEAFITFLLLIINTMEENVTKPFSPGDVAVMHITHRWTTNDGWATGGAAAAQKLRLFQSIDINKFPSHNDFIGYSRTFSCGENVLVTKYIGRPLHCTHRVIDSEYDVYEILAEGRTYQALRWNLSKPDEYDAEIGGTVYADNLIAPGLSLP